jgi:DNA polymerase-1
MGSSRTKRPALLVDGTWLLVRSGPPGRRSGLSSNGLRTGPLMMFITSLAAAIRLVQPADIVVCFDGKNGTAWRKAIWPGYKGNRFPVRGGYPEDELILEFCHRAMMSTAIHPDWEADDMIAAFWRTFRRAGRKVMICAEDADFRQLIDEDTIQLSPYKYQQPWDLKRVWAHYGCGPEDLSLLRAMTGDKSDGIPGLPDIGIKKAVKLLGEPMPEPVRTYRRLIELASPEQAPDKARLGGDWWSQKDPRLPWEPRQAAVSVLPFLRRYELEKLAESLEAGKLW